MSTPVRRLTTLYLGALLLVAVLAGVGSWVIHGLIARQQGSGDVINLAGRQRMRSQRLAKASLALLSAPTPEQRRHYLEELKGTVARFEQTQAALQGGNSPELRALFARAALPQKALTTGVAQLLARVAAPEPAPFRPALPEIVQILASEGQFLSDMEAILARYQFEFEARAAWLNAAENLLLAVIWVTLVLEALFVFRPTTRLIRESFSRLGNQEQELRETNRQLDEALQEAERAVKAKSVFLATMSHEIRTPMNGVIGMTGILGATELTDLQRDCLETLHASGESLLTIINDVLDFSKIESGHMTLERAPFNLRHTIEEVFDLFSPKIQEKNLEVACLIEANVPSDLMGDAARLRQILVNLVGNAIKFTPQGEIMVHVASQSQEADQHRLRFSVVDTGIGISPEAIPRLFQCFQQEDSSTTRRYGGSGLGLAISKRLSELMAGTMWVESEAGKGSAFCFTALLDAVPFAGAAPPTREQAPLLSHSILVVDDNASNRRILQLQLTAWGMVATAVASGRDALATLRDQSFDVALLDYHMPDMDGLALAQAIREQGSMPLILLSSAGQLPGPEVKALFVSQVVKPVKQTLLFESLKQALGREGKRPTARTAPRFDRGMAVHSPLRILLTDDNLINQKVGLMMLANFGYKPDLAANGVLALKAMNETAYDLVLMDVQMPEMDGIEAVRRIRRQSGATQPFIIALTADALEGDRERLLGLGFDAYLPKPLRAELLQDVLRTVAARE